MFPVFNPHSKKSFWDEATICGKLKGLSQAKKASHWIHTDLSVSRSSCPGRLFWKVAKHFDCLRDLYFINPQKSLAILSSLRLHLEEHGSEDLKRLYFVALENFLKITGKRIVSLNLPVIEEPLIPTVVLPPVQSEVFLPTHREIPGAGRFDPRREIVPPIGITRPPTIAGRVIPGTGKMDLQRAPVAPKVSTVAPPLVRVPSQPLSTMAGRVIPGAGRVDPGRVAVPMPAVTRPVIPVAQPTGPAVGAPVRVIPGTRGFVA